MKEDLLRDSMKEDIAILGIIDYKNIVGFRLIFGKDKEDLTVAEIVDRLPPVELPILRDLIKRTITRHKNS